MGGRYANEEQPPDGIPPPGDAPTPIQVFVRLVGGEHGEHWRTATARRWTSNHVLVSFVDGGYPGYPNAESLAWLHKDDVARIVPAAEMRAWVNGQRGHRTRATPNRAQRHAQRR
ncbi:hypothetical protein E1262_27140 [Jiangella aurantiaca]|uniref:Uncharacterized protein n=1 Tax=Jiangella aurantiaca TaxID=2530373 RepID=A0A4V2YR52_9ACTN|nr:hypothetical protein [Jiangella aurantiaca]TDD64767.1 hypothetical protein E1262_27140 [Jiangella aurantiaca]